ncbi:lysozyme [Chitinimonas sp.]|uniref:lysozyme n=1 Tax=Chitinimonas sp. TaxID=1934313 RepID=UPI002F95861D
MSTLPSVLRARLLAAGATGTVLATALLIAPSEGERRQTYSDPVGIPTACFGQTGPAIHMGQRYSAEQCAAMLVGEVGRKLAEVDTCTPGLPGPLRQAFTSFAYNVGTAAYCRSSMAAKARKGDYAGACTELSRWVYAGGKPLPGLVSRRARERTVCEEALHVG